MRSRNELAEHIGYYDDWIVLPPLGQGRIGYLEPTQEVYQGGPMYAAATVSVMMQSALIVFNDRLSVRQPFLELLEHCTSGLIKARSQTGLRQLCSNSFRTVRRMNARSVHCDIKPDNTAVRVRLDKALDDPERHQVVFLDHEGSLPVGTPLGLHT